jgi:ABC-2 type transport system permease protein
MRAFLGFVRKETLHLLRDRQTLAILILFPVIQVLIFGFAVRTDVRDIALAVVDPTPDVATLELRARFDASDRFHIVSVAASSRDLDLQFRRGMVRRASGSPGLRIDAPVRLRYNPTLESAHLFVPGLVAFVLTIVSALMTAISISRERETGTMEMLLVSPITPKAIVAGKVMPYIVLGFVSVLLVLVAARTVFGVPLRGSLPLLLAESGLYIVTALALGIVISTKAPNQRTAMIAALAGLMMPTLLLSGFIFPLDSLPWPLQWLSHLVPARWFLTIVRGIMLKGAGLPTLWEETVILIGMTIFLLAVGSKKLAIRLG